MGRNRPCAAALLLTALSCLASAQIPDVRVKFDLTLSLRTDKGQPGLLKAYSVMGRHSTVGLIFFLEPGFRGYVSQKLQKFDNEADDEFLEEYYVEDPGIWRVGKQFLPFGSGQMLRESVLAARADTNLILEHFPISLAVADGGAGRQRGFTARIGNLYGLSAAYGRHFGIGSTALTQIRRPEDSPGVGRGWKLAVGADYTRRVKDFTYRAEGIAFREGETALDDDLTLADVSITWQKTRAASILAGWTRILPSRGDVFRIAGSFRMSNTTQLEPILRYRSERLYDAALEVRVRF
jgi:hypothetical protein